jgi:hypothetical protein
MSYAGAICFAVSLTPTARSAAVDVTEESYDVTVGLQRYATGLGTPLVLAVTDFVSVNPPSALSTHVGIVGARVVNATTIAIQWGNFTAAANVPPAGSYVFNIQRP